MFTIRKIQKEDNPKVAQVIRTVMPEFGASGPGFAIHDKEVDEMFESYSEPRCVFFVVTDGDRVLGGAGISPLPESDGVTCELRKMYFMPEIRGQGLGQKLIDRCMVAARELGFRRCYLETLVAMDKARVLYLKNGFKPLDKTMGNTGHFGCDSYFLKEL